MSDGATEHGDPGHNGDPWEELTDDVVRLAEKLKATYRQVADEEGPSEAEIRQALATLAGAWNQIARWDPAAPTSPLKKLEGRDLPLGLRPKGLPKQTPPTTENEPQSTPTTFNFISIAHL